MISQDKMYEAISGMLIDAQLGYATANIFQGLQSNMVIQEKNNYCIFQELSRKPTSITSAKDYHGADQTITASNVDEVYIQMDFYGDIGDNASAIFYLYLQSFAPEFLYFNLQGVTLGVLSDVKNLTIELDRGKFAKRYILRFYLYIAQNITRTVPMTDKVNVIPTYIGARNPNFVFSVRPFLTNKFTFDIIP